MTDSSSHREFLRRLEEGHVSAVAELAAGRFGYADRLLEEARRRIGRRLRLVYGEQDAVQSVWRVLLPDLQSKERTFKHSWALWQFLRTILIRRIRSGPPPPPALPPDFPQGSPPPFERIDAKDLVDTAMKRFTPQQQQILRLYGDTGNRTQVAKEVGCSRRTVDRVLERFAAIVATLSDQKKGDNTDGSR